MPLISAGKAKDIFGNLLVVYETDLRLFTDKFIRVTALSSFKNLQKFYKYVNK